MDLSKIKRINHIAFSVKNLAESKDFYERIFNAKYSGSLKDMVFLWIGDTDFTLEKAKEGEKRRLGHLGIYLEEVSLVDDFAQHLKDNRRA